MSVAKMAVSMDKALLAELDRLVAKRVFASRSPVDRYSAPDNCKVEGSCFIARPSF